MSGARAEGHRHGLRAFAEASPAARALPEGARARLAGHVHSYETAGTLDGPGIRFVAFLSGCYYRCRYCHNPDTWKPGSGWHVTADELMEQVDHYAAFLGPRAGGVTLSGGEPLVQAAFAAEIFARSRARGLHTALDTNGSLGARMDAAMLADTDLVLLDLKSGDPATHERVTGAPLGPVRAFAERLGKEGKPVWVRFVLVPGLTDDPDNVAATARIAAGIGTVERVEVLPFHQMGAYKWEALGLDYRLRDTAPPGAALVDRVRAQFRDEGLFVP